MHTVCFLFSSAFRMKPRAGTLLVKKSFRYRIKVALLHTFAAIASSRKFL